MRYEKLSQVTVEIYGDPVIVSDHLVLDNFSTLFCQCGLNSLNRRCSLITFAGKKSESQLARFCISVERKPGGVGTPVLATIQHVDQELSGLEVLIVVFVHDTGDSAHGLLSVSGRSPSRYRLVRITLFAVQGCRDRHQKTIRLSFFTAWI